MMRHRCGLATRLSVVQAAHSINDAVNRLRGVRALLGRGRIEEADLMVAQTMNWLVDLRNDLKDDDTSWGIWSCVHDELDAPPGGGV